LSIFVRKEAEELDANVMEIRKGVLGEEHPSTLQSMNLAIMWKEHGRDAEAVKLMEECAQLQAWILVLFTSILSNITGVHIINVIVIVIGL
jgi:hypothetical protein